MGRVLRFTKIFEVGETEDREMEDREMQDGEVEDGGIGDMSDCGKYFGG